MQYQGGKCRSSNEISEVINAVSRRQVENIQNIGRTNIEHMFKQREREREHSLACFVEVAQ